MSDLSMFSDSYGDRLVASNFVEQVGFYSDRIVIEQYRHYQGRLPSIIIRIGWSTKPADPRDLEILAELAEDYGPPTRSVSDAVLEVPAGQLVVKGAYLPREPEQLELPLDVPVADDNNVHPSFKDIVRIWKGEVQ